MHSYEPENLFDANGSLFPELSSLIPAEEKRMGANPYANGGQLLKEIILPSCDDYAIDVPSPGTVIGGKYKRIGKISTGCIPVE